MPNTEYYIPKDVEFGGGRPPMPSYQRFVEGIQMGMLPEQAAKHAGSKEGPRFITRAMKHPWVQQRVKEIRDEMEAKMKMSRQKVQDMVVEAYDMAKLQAMPGDMIRACGELNKMLGYYAPEEKVINHKTAQLQDDLVAMDEEELLRLAGEELDAIEAEFKELDDIHAEEANTAQA